MSEKRFGMDRKSLLGSSESRTENVIHACGVTVIAVMGLKIALKIAIPVLGKIGKILTGGGKAPKKTAAIIPTGPSEDKWHVEDSLAPQLAADYKTVASGTLPCSVQEFYSRVVSSQTDVVIGLQAKCGKHRDIVASGWKSSGSPSIDDGNLLHTLGKDVFDFVLGTPASGGFCRTLTFVNPKKPPAGVDAACVQRQQFCVYKGDVLVFATAMNMTNIPFKDCFTVNTAWIVKPEGDGKSCSITIHLKVNFVKGCMVAAIIRSTTNRDSTLFYKAYIEEAAAVISRPPVAAVRQGTLVRARGSAVAGQGAGGAGATESASRLEVSRHLRVFFVMAIIVGSLVHQLSLHNQLGFVHRMLVKDL